MKRILFIRFWLIIFSGVIISQGVGQDTFFTQYFSSPLLINPALTGISTGIRARFNYRNQWPAMPKSYQAYYFSADVGDRALPGSGGLGLIFNADNEGTGFIHNLEVGATISVRIRINNFLLTQIGIKASYRQKSVNWDDFVFTDDLSAKYGFMNTTKFSDPAINSRSVADFGVGGLLQYISDDGSSSGTMGFAVDHLFQPDMSFLSTGEALLYRRWVIHADGVFSFGGSSRASINGSGDATMINPGIVFQRQWNVNSFEVGLNGMKYNIYLGTWFKTSLTSPSSNSLAVLAGYRLVTDIVNVRFIYSYDIPISGAYVASGGAHEVSLVFDFDKVSIFGGGGSGFGRSGSKRNKEPKECPSFY